MGQVIKKLSHTEVSDKTVFNNRFVIELCENVHVHYRNLRINLSPEDFTQLATGFINAMHRWKKLGFPEPNGQHVELCRVVVGKDIKNDGVKITLNKNLYLNNKDKIFAEGADFDDKEYVHVKSRDCRLEYPIKEFKIMCDNFAEAKKVLDKE